MSLLLALALPAFAVDIRATTAADLTAATLSTKSAWATFPTTLRGKAVTLTLADCAASRCTVMRGTRAVGSATGRYANQEVSYIVGIDGAANQLQVVWAPGEAIAMELVRLGW